VPFVLVPHEGMYVMFSRGNLCEMQSSLTGPDSVTSNVWWYLSGLPNPSISLYFLFKVVYLVNYGVVNVLYQMMYTVLISATQCVCHCLVS